MEVKAFTEKQLFKLTIPETMEKAVENVEYWEVAEEGLDLYDYEGNVYRWR